MNRKNKKWLSKLNIFKSLVMGALLVCDTSFIQAESLKDQEQMMQHILNEWNELHLKNDRCKMHFPSEPEHVSEKVNMGGEEGFDLNYDAYISAMDKQGVYMLLVAKYPEFVDESYAHTSLEGFLNGMMKNNPTHQLIFADLLLFEGHEALDFFIRNGSVYFKGRALMVKNHLYLIALECEMQHYDEHSFNAFVSSFKLAK
ncbi:MAG: hypothetical protein ACOVOQ_09810 [Flavobacterium sp.]